MSIIVGSNTLTKVYEGSKELDAVYVNNDQIYTKLNVPTITSFAVLPAFIYRHTYTSSSPDQTLNLSWATTGATSQEIHYTRADGTRANLAIGAGVNATSVVMPRQDTVFTLTTTNASGSAHAQAIFVYRTTVSISSFSIAGYHNNPGFPSSITALFSYSVIGHPRPTITVQKPGSAAREVGRGATHDSSTATTTGTFQRTEFLSGTAYDVVFTLTANNGLDTAATATTTFRVPA